MPKKKSDSANQVGNALVSLIPGTIFYTTLKTAANDYLYNSRRTSKDLPENILQNLTEPAIPINHEELKRILQSLYYNFDSFAFDKNNLTKKQVNEIAVANNCSTFHLSGNCGLLSKCFIYNIKANKNILAVSNTYPVYQSVHPAIVDFALFYNKSSQGEPFIRLGKATKNLTDIETEILNEYKKSGEVAYLIETSDYPIPIFGETSHAFNAVVIKGKNNIPEVLFVDSWRKSEPLMSKERVLACYPNVDFTLLKCRAPIPELQTDKMHKDDNKNERHTL